MRSAAWLLTPRLPRSARPRLSVRCSYVYNTGAGDKSGGFVAQLTFTKTDLDTDEFLTGALAQLDGPAWDRPAMAAEEEEAEEKA